MLRGRCRSCGASIPARYPAVELLTALLVAGCFWKFGLSGSAFVAAFFCITLVAVSGTDVEHQVIPNRIVLPAAAIVLAANTALHPSAEWALGALGASGFLFAAALAYPKGMGMGDVKLALLMGAALGRTVPVALMLGMLAALGPGPLPPRPPRQRRQEDADPVRALPGPRLRRRPVLGPRAALGVLAHRALRPLRWP